MVKTQESYSDVMVVGIWICHYGWNLFILYVELEPLCRLSLLDDDLSGFIWILLP